MADAVSVEVLELVGRVWQSRRQILQEGRNEIALRLATLPMGVYLIRLREAAGDQATVRVSNE